MSESGTYLVRIKANQLTATGSYNLGLSCLLPTDPPATPVVCGDLLSGSIDASGEADFYNFTGNVGDVIEVTLTETGSSWGGSFGDNDPRATVFSPTGAVVVAFDATKRQEITLTESGTYLVRINANQLTATGSYNLGLDCPVP